MPARGETWRVLSRFEGVNLRDDPSEIADAEAQVCKNLICDDETLRLRPGCSRKNATAFPSIIRVEGIYRAKFANRDPCWIVAGSGKLYCYLSPNTAYDITPTGIASGWATMTEFQNAVIAGLPWTTPSYPVWYRWATTTDSNTDWHEIGDGGEALSIWTIAGATEDNTNEGRVYWSLTRDGDNATVSLYSDYDKTALVAQGTADISLGEEIITLAEQNSSGLSGTVLCQQDPSADTDAGNSLTHKGITRILDPIAAPTEAPGVAAGSMTIEGFEATTGWTASDPNDFNVGACAGSLGAVTEDKPDDDESGTYCFELNFDDSDAGNELIYREFGGDLDLSGHDKLRIWQRRMAVQWGVFYALGAVKMDIQMGSEAGDGDDQLSGWAFAHANWDPGELLPDACSDSGQLYVSLTWADTTATISVYKDSGKAAEDKVAEGSGAQSTTIELAEEEDSGLTGYVAVAAKVGDDTDITIKPIRMAAWDWPKVDLGLHSRDAEWSGHDLPLSEIDDDDKNAINYLSFWDRGRAGAAKIRVDFLTVAGYRAAQERSFCYTWRDSLTGRESAPSPKTPDISVGGAEHSALTVVGSDDSDVDKLRIYAKPQAGSLYRLAKEIDNPTTTYVWHDTLGDTELTDILNEDVDTPPECSIVYRHGGRVFYAANDDHPCRFYMTDLNEAARISTRAEEDEWGIAGGYMDISPDDGGHILAIGSFGNVLFIWKDNGTYQLIGDSRRNFAIEQFAEEGIVGRWAWCEADGYLFWVSPRNIWQYDGASNQLYPIGDKLGTELLADLSDNTVIGLGNDLSLAYHDRKLFLFSGASGGPNDYVIYDLQRKHWTGRHDGTRATAAVTSVTAEVGTTAVPLFVGGDVAEGRLYTLWSGYTDDNNLGTGNAIAWEWCSKRFDAHPGWKEQVTALRLTATVGTTQNVAAAVYADNGTPYSSETLSFTGDTKETKVWRPPHTIIGDRFYLKISGSSSDSLVIHDVGLATRPIRRLG